MDRRISKTKSNIMETFCILSESMDISEITVSHLSEQAGISRSTFYQHYTDVYVLLEKIEKDYIGKMHDLKLHTDALGDPKAVMNCILSFLKQHRRMFLILYKNRQHTDVFHDINELVRKTFYAKVHHNFVIPEAFPEAQLRMIIEFITAGCYKLYIDVITGKENGVLEQLSEQISRLSDACLTAYFRKK